MLLTNLIDNKGLFKDELSSDVTFILHDRNGVVQTIPAHKAILKARSPVFEGMFFGNLKEGDSVAITDVSAEAFNEYLQCFYLAELELTAVNIREVLKLIDKYDTQTLQPLCQKFIDETAKPEVMYMYYDLALSHKLALPKLERAIFQNLKKTLKFDVGDGCTKWILLNLLKSDEFIRKEVDIFGDVIAWAETSLKNQNIAVTVENIEKEIADLVHHIRFPIMSVAEFLSCIEKYPNLLSRQEYFDIHYYISTKRQLTVAQHFSTQYRQASSCISIDFEPFNASYVATLDHFYFLIGVTKQYLLTIWMSTTSSDSWECKIFAGSSIIYTEPFIRGETCSADTTSFRLSQPINFEVDGFYEIELRGFGTASARFCLKQEEQAIKYPFISYKSGYRGSVISKIEFAEV